MRHFNDLRRPGAAAVIGAWLAAAGLPAVSQAQEPVETLESPAPADPAVPQPPPPPEVAIIAIAPEAPAEALDRPSDVVELDEVVVTAQKTRQNLRQVPASVTALSGEAMRNSKIISPNDTNGYVPNTQMRVSPFAGEIRIRGYGTSVSNAGFESSVGLVIDDVYYGRTAFLSALMYDVDRFEVIRGPQGALFGKNTVAGVVNIATVDAEATTSGDVTIFSRDDLEIRDARGGVSIPLADGVYTRLGASVTSYDGLYYNTALQRNEADLSASAARIKLRLTDVFGGELRLAASMGEQKGNGNLFQIAKASPATLALFRQYDPQAETNPYNRTLSSNVPSQVDVFTKTAQANYTVPLGAVWGLSNLDFSSITAYASNEARSRTIDFDFSPVPVVRLDLVKPTPYTQVSQEFRLTGSSPTLFGVLGKTDFIGGLYYLDSSLLSNDRVKVEDLSAAGAFVIAARGGGAFTDASGAPLGGAAADTLASLLGMVTSSGLSGALLSGFTAREQAELLLDQDQRAYAAYGQVTTYLTDRLAAILGWRFGRETKDGHMSSSAPGSIFLPIILGQQDHDSYRHRSETESSPKVGLKYDFTSRISSYLVYGEGFKGGGFNALPFNPNNLEYGPERARAVEAGVKARLFDGTFDASLAVYRTDFDDLQVSVYDGTTYNTTNAAAAVTQGVEGDFRWLTPLPGTSIRGNVGYSDAHYTSYRDGPTQAGAQQGDPYVGPCSTNPDALCQDLSGRTLATAPKWSASLIPTLALPGFGPSWGFQFSVEGLYTSKRYLDVDLDPNTLQKETLQFNGRISVGARDGAWSVSLLAQNLTEEKILSQITDEPVAPGNFGAIRADRGREFYGALAFNF